MAFLLLLAGSALSAAEPAIDVTVTVDFGRDVGQNFGTLFEARDANGRLVCGAGFVSAYNSYFRMERYKLQFFGRPAEGAAQQQRRPLPRVSSDVGAYVFDWRDGLYAESDSTDTVRRWDADRRRWEECERLGRNTCVVRGKRLQLVGDRVLYDGQVILDRADEGRRYLMYYAQGFLFFYHKLASREGAKGYNRVCAVPWSPYQEGDLAVDASKLVFIDTSYPEEFPYAYGQLGGEVLNCSNWGGLYAFDGRRWKVLVAPERTTSYQIYTMINYGDRLLMGQYPTGFLFAYDGRKVTTLKDWPPVPAAASPAAREAQTAMIYRGELFVGVWPWAELWRRDPDAGTWVAMGRMFTHPDVHANPVHPYEAEATAAGLVSNWLGQRLTSMVAMRDRLVIGTSTKGGWGRDRDTLRAILDAKRLEEYGTVYEMTMPGNLSAVIRWTDRPTTLRFVAGAGRMAVLQDGKELASVPIAPSLLAGLSAPKFRWSAGVFGPLKGTIQSHEVK